MSKPLDNTSTKAPTSVDVAAAVLNAAQLVLRLARAEVRRQHPVNLSLTQLRALDYLSANPDTSLSAAAGVPDIGLLTLHDFVEAARTITLASSLPLLCDADTGFGQP